jgi:glucan phosphoethanolaminetransferase (alkaline phosphatase superfamily)
MHIQRQLHTDNKMVVLIFLVLVLLSATMLINECGISILEPVLFAVNMAILIFVVLNMVFGEGEQLNIIFKHTLHTTLAATSMAASAVFRLLPTKIKTKIQGKPNPITKGYAMATVTYIAVLGFIVGVGVHALFFPRYTTGLSKAVSERNYLYEPVSSLHSSGGLYSKYISLVCTAVVDCIQSIYL